jgi:hypothetical protein
MGQFVIEITGANGAKVNRLAKQCFTFSRYGGHSRFINNVFASWRLFHKVFDPSQRLRTRQINKYGGICWRHEPP